MTEVGAIYVGVGVGEYDAYQRLPRAVPDAKDVGEVLQGYGYRIAVVKNPGGKDIWPTLDGLLPMDGMLGGGRLVVMWGGHGEQTPEGELRLAGRDSVPRARPAITPKAIASLVARTGASQILLVFDTCYSLSALLEPV